MTVQLLQCLWVRQQEHGLRSFLWCFFCVDLPSLHTTLSPGLLKRCACCFAVPVALCLLRCACCVLAGGRFIGVHKVKKVHLCHSTRATR